MQDLILVRDLYFACPSADRGGLFADQREDSESQQKMAHILDQPPGLRVVLEEDAPIGVINAAVAAEKRLQKQANRGLGRREDDLRHELVGGADIELEISHPLVRAISLRDPAPSLSIDQSIPVAAVVSDL